MKGFLHAVIFKLFQWLGRKPFASCEARSRKYYFWLKPFLSTPRRITRTNLSMCFPDKSNEEINQLTEASMLETLQTALEMSCVYFQPATQLIPLIQNTYALDKIQNALDNQQGVLLLCPHLGNWEMANLFVSDKFDMSIMYRPIPVERLDAQVAQARSQQGVKLLTNDRKGLVSLFKMLKSGGLTAILPDQEPTKKTGVFAPFFGIEAITPKLVFQMIEKTNCKCLMISALRNTSGGFDIHVEDAEEDTYSKDLDTHAKGMNRSIEKMILKAPMQWQWEYKRFGKRPEGVARRYT
jgi:KDO2-lipid IV(A) lauroyltransferase